MRLLLTALLALFLGCGVFGSDDEDKKKKVKTDDDDSGDATGETGDKVVGKISGIEGSLEFTPKSVYAMVAEIVGRKSFVVLVSQVEVTEFMLTKKIKEYTCTSCEGDCDESPETQSNLSITLGDAQDFTDPLNPVQLDIVDDDGFPVSDTYANSSIVRQGVTILKTGGEGTLYGGKSSGNVLSFTKKPKAIGDDFRLYVDIGLVEVAANDFSAPIATWQGELTGKVFAPVSQTVAAPDCGDGEYPKPTFED